MVSDQRFPAQFQCASLEGDERFLLIVKNRFPKKLSIKVLQAHVKAPYRSLLGESSSNFEQAKHELDTLRRSYLDKPQPLPPLGSRTNVGSSQSGKEQTKTEEHTIKIPSSATTVANVYHNRDEELLGEIQRQKTFYPSGWPKSKRHFKKLNKVKMCFISSNENRVTKLETETEMYPAPIESQSVPERHNGKVSEPFVGRPVHRSHLEPLQNTTGSHQKLNSNISLTVSSNPQTYYGSYGRGNRSMDHREYFSLSDGTLPIDSLDEESTPTQTNGCATDNVWYADSDISVLNDETISDNKQRVRRIQTKLPALDMNNSYSKKLSSLNKHTKQTGNLEKPRKKLPRIKDGRQREENGEPERAERIQRKPVISSMIQLRDLVNTQTPAADFSRVIDPYSVYLKYNGHKQVIDSSIYNRHARKGGAKRTIDFEST